MHRNALLIIFVLFYGNYSLIAQVEPSTDLSYQSNEETSLIAKLEKELEEDLSTSNISNNEDIRKVYEARTQRLIDKIQNNHFIFDSPMNERLERILQHIVEKNPAIPKDRLRIFLSRYFWPNASCLGEGTMVFNIGLFRRLENDDQIAFILCHELAHFTEDHVNESVRKNIAAREELLGSDEFKNIAKQEYGSYEAKQNLLKNFTFDNKRHSRTHEKEADHLGMNYYVNTKYAASEAIRCLEILDEIDEEKYAGKVDLKNLFDNSEYPFQNRWLRTKSSGLSVMKKATSEWNSDSLKTHPDCVQRIDLIKRNFSVKELIGEKVNTKESYFAEELLLADFEIVQSTFDFSDLGRCLYYSFQLLGVYPENAYLRATVGRCLYHLYHARKNHELNEYVAFPSRQEKEYLEVLRFIHNLRLSELKKLNYHFLSGAAPVLRKNEDYLFSLVLSSSLLEDKEMAKQFLADYQTAFPGGKYSDWVEGLLEK